MADRLHDDADQAQHGPSALTSGVRRARWPIALALVWAALAVTDGVVMLPSGASSQPTATHQGATGHRQGGGDHGSPQSSGGASPSASPSPSPRVLIPVSASAFGPAGSGSGDNPQTAAMAIDASTATAWQTDWYRSAEFGNLKTWSGLLIDMGHAVRITSVRILLGSTPGADLAVRTEKVPSPATDQNQASASNAGGVVRLDLARPKRARYLLIWFTVLPPDPAGTFQVSVYNVSVRGTP